MLLATTLAAGALLTPCATPQRSAVQMSASLPPPQLPDNWKAPEPKPLSLPEGQLASALTGTAALALRLGSGVFAVGWKPEALGVGADEGKYQLYGFRDSSSTTDFARPEVPLKLYEYEASPYCRKVREAASMLDLRVTMLPCPGARKGFAAELGEVGGKMTVPYLVDENNGVSMYESDDIIDYMFDTYGPGADAVPWTLRGGFAFTTSAFAALARGMAGSQLDAKARPDNTKMAPLELWAYEGSPFVKPVRERLNELALPHTVVACPRGSANRDKMVEMTGRFQVPYLRDPNTGADLYESDEIVRYLGEVYTV